MLDNGSSVNPVNATTSTATAAPRCARECLTKGTTEMTTPTTPRGFAWLNDSTQEASMPYNVTRWLRVMARRGAVIVTDKHGNRTAYIDTPTKWRDVDGVERGANGIYRAPRNGKNGVTERDALGNRYPTTKPAID